MSPKAADIMEQAQKLTDEERRELAIELLDSAIEPEIRAPLVSDRSGCPRGGSTLSNRVAAGALTNRTGARIG